MIDIMKCPRCGARIGSMQVHTSESCYKQQAINRKNLNSIEPCQWCGGRMEHKKGCPEWTGHHSVRNITSVSSENKLDAQLKLIESARINLKKVTMWLSTGVPIKVDTAEFDVILSRLVIDSIQLCEATHGK